MTKRDLIEELLRQFPRFARRDAEVMVNTVFDTMTEALCRGDRDVNEIKLRGSYGLSGNQPNYGDRFLTVTNAGLIDGLFVNGSAWLARGFGAVGSWIQSGQVGAYAWAFVIGVIAVLGAITLR